MAKKKYDTHVKPFLEVIRAWKRRGVTDKEICEKLQISQESFYLYKREHAEFSDILMFGLDHAVALMENAHFKSGIGFEYEEVKVIVEPTGEFDENGKEISRRKIEKTKKLFPGNITAQIHFLKNRASKDWHDRKEVELTGKDGNECVFKVKVKRHDDN
jgi:hypothetical protein